MRKPRIATAVKRGASPITLLVNDVFSAESSIANAEVVVLLALEAINQRDAGVLRRYYGIGVPPMSLEEIGNVMVNHTYNGQKTVGLTGGRVQQLKSRGLRRLRHRIGAAYRQLIKGGE